jgi:hypothetical protein
VGPRHPQPFQQAAQVLGIVLHRVPLGGRLRGAGGAAIVEDGPEPAGQNSGMVLDHESASLASAQAAVDHHQGLAFPIHFIVHPIAVDQGFRHGIPPLRYFSGVCPSGVGV